MKRSHIGWGKAKSTISFLSHKWYIRRATIQHYSLIIWHNKTFIFKGQNIQMLLEMTILDMVSRHDSCERGTAAPNRASGGEYVAYVTRGQECQYIDSVTIETMTTKKKQQDIILKLLTWKKMRKHNIVKNHHAWSPCTYILQYNTIQ